MTTGWPAPTRDDKSAPFYDAAARDALAIRRCQDCATHLPPEAVGCTQCGSGELDWTTAAGTGRLVTWTTVHRAPNQFYADLIPYVLGIVELDEGPWLHARIVSADTGRPPLARPTGGSDLHEGSTLRARFVHSGDVDSYPVFAPDEA